MYLNIFLFSSEVLAMDTSSTSGTPEPEILTEAAKKQKKENEEALISNVMQGEYKAAIDKLDAGVDPNIRHSTTMTPLHYVAIQGGTEGEKMVEALLNKGADVNARTYSGMTPLYYAARSGHTSVVVALLGGVGTDLNCVDLIHEQTPLHHAVMNGYTDVAKALIKARANVNAKDKQNLTPLHHAIINGHTDVVEALIDAGAKVNIRDKQKFTPLHDAIIKGHTDMAKDLIKAGANVNAKDKQNLTPLHHAVINGHTDVVKALINAKAKVNIRDKQKFTPLHHAIINGHTDMATDVAKALIEAGADVNITVRDRYGEDKPFLDLINDTRLKDELAVLAAQAANTKAEAAAAPDTLGTDGASAPPPASAAGAATGSSGEAESKGSEPSLVEQAFGARAEPAQARFVPHVPNPVPGSGSSSPPQSAGSDQTPDAQQDSAAEAAEAAAGALAPDQATAATPASTPAAPAGASAPPPPPPPTQDPQAGASTLPPAAEAALTPDQAAGFLVHGQGTAHAPLVEFLKSLVNSQAIPTGGEMVLQIGGTHNVPVNRIIQVLEVAFEANPNFVSDLANDLRGDLNAVELDEGVAGQNVLAPYSRGTPNDGQSDVVYETLFKALMKGEQFVGGEFGVRQIALILSNTLRDGLPSVEQHFSQGAPGDRDIVRYQSTDSEPAAQTPAAAPDTPGADGAGTTSPATKAAPSPASAAGAADAQATPPQAAHEVGAGTLTPPATPSLQVRALVDLAGQHPQDRSLSDTRRFSDDMALLKSFRSISSTQAEATAAAAEADASSVTPVRDSLVEQITSFIESKIIGGENVSSREDFIDKMAASIIRSSSTELNLEVSEEEKAAAKKTAGVIYDELGRLSQRDSVDNRTFVEYIKDLVQAAKDFFIDLIRGEGRAATRLTVWNVLRDEDTIKASGESKNTTTIMHEKLKETMDKLREEENISAHERRDSLVEQITSFIESKTIEGENVSSREDFIDKMAASIIRSSSTELNLEVSEEEKAAAAKKTAGVIYDELGRLSQRDSVDNRTFVEYIKDLVQAAKDFFIDLIRGEGRAATRLTVWNVLRDEGTTKASGENGNTTTMHEKLKEMMGKLREESVASSVDIADQALSSMGAHTSSSEQQSSTSQDNSSHQTR